jgi:hypothetical protein
MRFHSLAFTLIFITGSLSAQAPPVPAEFQDLYGTLTTQIAGFNSAVNAGWDGSTFPYLNAPQLDAAASTQFTTLLGPTFYTYGVIPQLNELKALGANAVTVHIDFPIFYQPFYTYEGNPALYQQFVSFYQQLAQDIRARGMKLVVEATVGLPLVGNQLAQYQPYLQSLSWSDYMAGRAAQALAVAQLIQPDYMSVMTEPDSEESVSLQTNLNNVAGVTQLVQQVLTTLQTAGVSNVQIGAGAGTWTTNYMQYVQAYAGMPLNFVDMHIYPINQSDFTVALTAADMIHAAGKQVGLSECWDWKIRDNELGVLHYDTITARDPFSFWAPIDTSFLQAIVNFANYKQLAFISPFWIHYFFAYLNYDTEGSLPVNTVLTDSYSAAANANLTGGFTSTGHAWESQTTPVDTIPPGTPAIPVAAVVGTTTVNLTWPTDQDNVGVSAYSLYRNGTLLTTTSMPLYYDNGLVSGQTYTYSLTATDASGNVSPKSIPLVVETIDITAPSVPTNLVVTAITPGSPGSITLNWAPSTGIGGVGGYRILQGTTPQSMSIHANVTGPPYSAAVSASTTYYFQVESYNPLGVTSGPSNQVTATSAQSIDSTPPSVPTNLAVTGVTAGSPGSITINWTPSTGIGGVGGYRILEGTAPGAMTVYANVTAPPYTFPNASASTRYYFQVESYNPHGATSAPSDQVTVTTNTPITQTPPPALTDLVVTAVTAGAPGSISLSWTPSADPGVEGYLILQGTSPTSMTYHAKVTGPSYTDTVTASTTYYFQVEAYNHYGVISGLSNQVSATSAARN